MFFSFGGKSKKKNMANWFTKLFGEGDKEKTQDQPTPEKPQEETGAGEEPQASEEATSDDSSLSGDEGQTPQAPKPEAPASEGGETGEELK